MRRISLVLILVLLSGVALADDFVGQANVIDGDTLEIHGTRIRLWGVDAPESGQLCRGEDSLPYRCGAQAANSLDAFIARRPVNCIPLSLDQYGRTVATCSVGGTDLGEWLVHNGLALDWPQYSKGRYGGAQQDAERAGRGIWNGSCVEPWLYRACIRANGSRPTARMTQTPIRDRWIQVNRVDCAGAASVVWATHANQSSFDCFTARWGRNGCSYP